MTAPAAPRLSYVHTDGWNVRLAFPAVSGAATYNVYCDGVAGGSTKALSGVAFAAQFTFPASPTDCYVRVTAVNGGAEESAASTEYHLNAADAGRHPSGPPSPFG